MKKINKAHLIALKGVAENETADSATIDILKTIDSPEDSESDLLKIMLNGETLIKKFFQARGDIPSFDLSEESRNFINVSTYTVKITLLLSLCSREKDLKNNRARKDFKSSLRKLISRQNIANLQNEESDTLIFLLRIMMSIYNSNIVKNDSDLKKELGSILYKFIVSICGNFKTKDSDSFRSLLVLINEKNDNDHSVLIKKFIATSRNFFVQQQGYEKRHEALQEILAAWEKLKDYLQADDISWLYVISQDIVAGYASLPSLYAELINDVKQLLTSIAPNCCVFLIRSGMVGLMIGAFYRVASRIQESRHRVIESLRDLLKLKEEKPEAVSLEALKRVGASFLGIEEITLESLDKAKELTETIANINSGIYTVSTSIIVGASIIGPPLLCLGYHSHQFFKQPSGPRPVTLPAWVSEFRPQ